MFYDTLFYITDPVWNNALSYDKRKNKQIYVPSLIKIENLDEIQLGDTVVFEDYDFDWVLQSCKWLKNFYEFEWNGKTIFLFDNHNHAYFFWYLARHRWIIGDNNVLYHMDEHSDMRDPGKYLLKPDSEDLEKVFRYCNFDVVNVGNYIVPAQKEGIVSEVVQIRSVEELEMVKREKATGERKGIIFNLDLDFFQPDLDFIGNDLKKEVFHTIAKEADVITVATSPFFIDQELALKVFRELFE